MQNELADTRQPMPTTGISVFDSGQFAQMWNIADALAQSSLIPDTLKGQTKEQTKANCLRVVEQASRWGLSPFAVMDSASVVHGKLMWEGKLIAAAITAMLGVRLRYDYSGAGDNRKVVVSGDIDGHTATIEGTVGDWKTTGKGSPWDNLANRDQMLAYRGARQWARRHAPEVILGVYAPDEMEDVMVNVTNGRRAVIKRDVEIVPSASSPDLEREEESRPQPEQEAGMIPAYIFGVDHDKGETKGKKWERFRVKLNIPSRGQEEVVATTFSTTDGQTAKDLTEQWVLVTVTEDRRGLKLDAIKLQPRRKASR